MATAVSPGVGIHGPPSTATSTDSTPVSSVADAMTSTGSVTHQPASPSAPPSVRLTSGSAASVTVTVATGRSAAPLATVPATPKLPGAA